MKDRPIVEPIFRFLAGRGMRPLALAFGKFHKVGYGFGRVLFKEPTDDVAFAGFKRRIQSGLPSHEILSVFKLSFGIWLPGSGSLHPPPLPAAIFNSDPVVF